MEFELHLCTTKEQSKRLLSLGLKRETADMGWVKNLNGYGYTLAIAEDYSFIDIPAWSIGRLWEILPKELELYGDEVGPKVFQKSLDPQSNIEYKASDSDVPIKYFWDGDIYDRLIDCFKWLSESGHIDSEYIDVDKLFSL